MPTLPVLTGRHPWMAFLVSPALLTTFARLDCPLHAQHTVPRLRQRRSYPNAIATGGTSEPICTSACNAPSVPNASIINWLRVHPDRFQVLEVQCALCVLLGRSRLMQGRPIARRAPVV